MDIHVSYEVIGWICITVMVCTMLRLFKLPGK